MTGSLCPQFDEFNFMMKAALKMVLNEHTYLREGNKLWPIKRVINMVKAKITTCPDTLVGDGKNQTPIFTSSIYVTTLITYIIFMLYVTALIWLIAAIKISYTTGEDFWNRSA